MARNGNRGSAMPMRSNRLLLHFRIHRPKSTKTNHCHCLYIDLFWVTFFSESTNYKIRIFRIGKFSEIRNFRIRIESSTHVNLTHTLTHTHTHTLTLNLTHTHTLTLNLTHTHTLSHTLTRCSPNHLGSSSVALMPLSMASTSSTKFS
jgi:hypothetical protein